MSRKAKILLSACFLIFFIGGIVTYFSLFAGSTNNYLQDIMNKISPNKGSIAKESITTKCNGKDTVCIQKDGKVTAQKKEQAEKPCEKTKNCYLQYAANERTAISAIRAYTGVPDMNLTPLIKDGTPDNITFYCNDSNRCWAVDHSTHKVIELK